MSAKITREIKPSKAEAGRRMLCGHGEAAMGNTLASSLCARRTAQLPQPGDPCGSSPAAAPVISGCEAEEGAVIRRPPTDA